MKRRFILSLAVLFMSLCAFAQSAVVGSVVDKNGEPVTGAAVIAVVNGAKVGAVADIDGKFSISVPKGTSLEFSALGFKTISVPAASGMTVVLEEDIDQLEETVIIG
ncbi:MAG: carboxypeptidase-like regulatory domain-containing protein, partial [Bacteroidales bacterium]|nr:carboxypeptidase-like regulatory domain-containing protein [Candidatus Equibacterium intestinale]